MCISLILTKFDLALAPLGKCLTTAINSMIVFVKHVREWLGLSGLLCDLVLVLDRLSVFCLILFFFTEEK